MDRRKGLTPAGGVRSEVVYLDDDGNVVDPDKAVVCHIHEYDENGNMNQETIGLVNGGPKMTENVDYTELVSRIVDEDLSNLGAVDSDEDGVDYGAEYRKQTGKDLETGEYASQ